MIGRKGKRACPPQFQYPSSVAVDRALGNIYVADYGNARIQILEVNGNMAREPLVLGGKCRPCALAVSLRGDLVMTDSQILRVFSKTGELTRQSCVSYPDLLIKESVDVQSTTTTMKTMLYLLFTLNTHLRRNNLIKEKYMNLKSRQGDK